MNPSGIPVNVEVSLNKEIYTNLALLLVSVVLLNVLLQKFI